MFKNILVAADGSDSSNRAIATAVKLAAKIKARLVFAFVTLPYTRFHALQSDQAPSLADHEHTNLEAAHRIFRVAKQATLPDKISFRSVTIEADQVWRGLLQAAKKESCDLICMASHGRSGLSALLLGSETQKVLTHTRVPLLVVR